MKSLPASFQEEPVTSKTYALEQNAESIDILSASHSVPVEVNVRHAAPRSLGLDLGEMAMTPFTMDYIKPTDQSPRDLRDTYKQEIRSIRSIRQYLRKMKKFLIADLRMTEKEVVQQLKKERDEKIKSSEKAFKKFLKKEYAKKIQEVRVGHKEARKKIRETIKDDQETLKSYIAEFRKLKQETRNKGDFNTKFIDYINDVYAQTCAPSSSVNIHTNGFASVFCVVIGIIVAIFGGLYVYDRYRNGQQLKEKAEQRFSSFLQTEPPPKISLNPEIGPFPDNLLQPKFGTEKTRVPAQTATKIGLGQKLGVRPGTLIENFNNYDAWVQQAKTKEKALKPLFSAFRFEDIIVSISDKAELKGFGRIQLAPEDIKKYENCGTKLDNVLSGNAEASTLSECDISSQATIATFAPESLTLYKEQNNVGTKNNFLKFGYDYISGNVGDYDLIESTETFDEFGVQKKERRLVFSVTHSAFGEASSQPPSAREWIKQNFKKYFTNTYVSENITAIDNIIDNTIPANSTLIFSTTSPVVCNQSTNFKIGVPGVVNVTTALSTGDLLVDGDYNIGIGVKEEGKPTVTPLVTTTIKNLSKNLGSSANILAQSKFRYPLQIRAAYNHAIDNQSKYELRKNLSFLVKNDTGNLFDVDINRVDQDVFSTGTKNPNFCSIFYSGKCIDGSDTRFDFKSRSVETGLYDITGKYSVVEPEVTALASDFTFSGNTHINHPTLTGEKQNVRFLSANIHYSTFSRYLDIPEAAYYVSEVVKDVNSDTQPTQQTGIVGTVYPLSIGDSNMGVFDASKVLTEQGIPFNNFNPQLVRELTPIVSNMNDTLKRNSNPFYDDILKFNFFNDIISDSTTLNRIIQPSTENTPKYLHIGAYINLKNRFTTFNNMFHNQDVSVPLLLQVYRNNGEGTELFAEFPFSAKLGKDAYLQTFWNGKSNLEQDDSADDKDVLKPQYTPGDYQLRVKVNEESLDDYIQSAEQTFNAFALYPYVFQPEYRLNPLDKFDYEYGPSSVATVKVKTPTGSGIHLVSNNFDLQTHTVKIKGTYWGALKEQVEKIEPNFDGLATYTKSTIQVSDNSFEIVIEDVNFTDAYYEGSVVVPREGSPPEIVYPTLDIRLIGKGGFSTSSASDTLGTPRIDPGYGNYDSIRQYTLDPILKAERLRITFPKAFDTFVLRQEYDRRKRVAEASNLEGQEGFLNYVINEVHERSIATIRGDSTAQLTRTVATEILFGILFPPNPVEHPYLFTLWAVATLAPIAIGAKPLIQVYKEGGRLALLAEIEKIPNINALIYGCLSGLKCDIAHALTKDAAIHANRVVDIIEDGVKNEKLLKENFKASVDDIFHHPEARNAVKKPALKYSTMLTEPTLNSGARFARATPEALRAIGKPTSSFLNSERFYQGLMNLSVQERSTFYAQNYFKTSNSFIDTNSVFNFAEHFLQSGITQMEKIFTEGVKISIPSRLPQLDEIAAIAIDFGRITPEQEEILRLLDSTAWSRLVDTGDGVKALPFIGGDTEIEIARKLAIPNFLNILNRTTDNLSETEKVTLYNEIVLLAEDALKTHNRSKNISGLFFTWHHSEDLRHMYLVQGGIHSMLPHIGGSKGISLINTGKATFEEWSRYTGFDILFYYPRSF